MPKNVPTYRPDWLPSRAERNKAYNERKRNAESTKFYKSGDWRHKLQPMQLSREPYCRRCLQEGRHTPACVVHHVRPIDEYPEGARDFDNMESLCRSCHTRHHNQERKGSA